MKLFISIILLLFVCCGMKGQLLVMNKFSLKMMACMATMMMSLTAQSKTQDFGGRVLDEKGEPMPYVNVVLLSLPDSAFVQGAMTDEQGVFKIVTDISDGLFKVTSVGYQTLYINAGNDLTIQMKEDTQLLKEVVVKSQMPKTHVRGDAMRTTVAGTILEKAGTVSDALGKIPSIETERGGSVTVLGRGDAEVYINGRKVQDLNELSRLRSDQIQHVDVVQNPGARYKASTKAVVRITLKKAQGEGFSFQDYFSGIYQYGHTLTNNLDVNYRTGGLDITASLWAGRYGHFYKYDRHPSSDFNLKRMGTLTFDLRCSDPFHTNKTDAIVYGYRELTTHNPARRTFTLDLTWKFNEARSKYRGSGAGEKQKARM